MTIEKCNSGTIVIQLDEDFSNITIKASGERINSFKGFCMSIRSIEQIKPEPRKIDRDEQKKIAVAISEWKDSPRQIEFFEGL